MHRRPPSSSVFVAPRQVVLLHDACGARVSSRAGCVWLTQSGDTRDVVLQPGESFRLDRAGTAVITSARGAEVSITPPPGRPVAVAVGAGLPAISAPHRGQARSHGAASGRRQTGRTLGRAA